MNILYEIGCKNIHPVLLKLYNKFYMNILYEIGCKNIHPVLLKLYNQFYMNILYEIVCKNLHTFMKKILLANLCWNKHKTFYANSAWITELYFQKPPPPPSGFGGLVVSMLSSGTRVRGFKPGRSLQIFLMEKSSACLPSEGKSNNLSHVLNLVHVKDPMFCSLNYGLLAKFVQVPSLAIRGLSRRLTRSTSGDDGRNHFRCGAQRACLHTA
jgi:hypothetical protein